MIARSKQPLRFFAVATVHAALFAWSDSAVFTEMCDANDAMSFQMPHYDDLLTVPVHIVGKEFLFLLDTGATFNVLDSQLAHTLGIPIRLGAMVQDIHGKQITGSMYHPPTAFIGSLKVEQNASILCVDLSTFRSASGTNIMGVLGMPFFRSSILRLDFDNKQIHIYPQSTKREGAWGHKIQVAETDNGVAEISATLGGDFVEPFVIDTGSSAIASLRPGLFEYLIRMGALVPTRSAHVMGLSGSRETVQASLSSISVAGYSIQNAEVGKSKTKRSRIGLDYLRRFHVTFDLGNRQIYLAKNKRFDEAEKDVYIGLGILRFDGKTIIKRIDSGSPAEHAGFLVDDELIAVAGESVGSKPLAAIRWRMKTGIQKEGALELDIRREGKVHSIRLTDN